MARPKKSKGMSVSTILSIVIVLFLALGLGLWLLKENATTPTTAAPNQVAVKPVTQNTTLPSRPEEVYSYIRDLETREVVTDPNKGQPKSAQLSKEQLAQLEEKRKQEETARLTTEQPVATEQPAEPEIVAEQPVAPSDAEIAAKKAHEQKLAEEKTQTSRIEKTARISEKSGSRENKRESRASKSNACKSGRKTDRFTT